MRQRFRLTISIRFLLSICLVFALKGMLAPQLSMPDAKNRHCTQRSGVTDGSVEQSLNLQKVCKFRESGTEFGVLLLGHQGTFVRPQHGCSCGTLDRHTHESHCRFALLFVFSRL